MNSKSEHTLYNLLTLGLEHQIKNRNELGVNDIMLTKSLNISIILNMTCLVEGLFEDILNKEISYLHMNIRHLGNDQLSTPVVLGVKGIRILRKLLKDLDLGNWSDLLEMYKTIIGESLAETIGDELFKSLQIQRSIRNVLGHGKTITYNKTSLKSYYSGKYEIIYKYLIEKKLTKKRPNEDITLFFDSTVIDHFIINSLKTIDIVKLKFNASIQNFDLLFFDSQMEKIKTLFEI